MSAELETWLAGRADRIIETSCARIYLAGDCAWKIKRRVNLGFLDFTTLEKRKWALDRELGFNRETAADIYLDVHAITRRGDSFEVDGAGEVAEWLLEMRRFDPDAVFSERVEAIDGDLAERLGRIIAQAHIAAPVRRQNSLVYVAASNAEHLRAVAATSGLEGVEDLIARTNLVLNAHASLIESRMKAGLVRRCHGDLHLGNILLENDQPVLFDCIEFNDLLSDIDVQYDVAFTLMDMTLRAGARVANRLLNAWLDEAARGLPDSLWRGLALMPLMFSVRAAIRAHVTAAQEQSGWARTYLEFALAALSLPAPRLFAVGGLSGSGKSQLARKLAPLVGAPPGAVVLRSDEIRKRLWRRGAFDRLPARAYSPSEDTRVFDEMFALAHQVLDAGHSVILDATFLDPALRARAEDLGGAKLEGFWLGGETDELRARLAARGPDASDADLEVLERQLSRDPGHVTWRKLALNTDLDQLARAVARG